MANGKFVTYYRVSSRKQGKSGLGLDAQRSAATTFLQADSKKWTKQIAELVEVESGKRNARPKLTEALALCRVYNAVLIIAKLDRLSRNVAFIANLMESGVEFCAVDMPTASKFTLHILAAVAEQEAVAIADRTKKALATAKARGTLLGRRDGAIAAHSSKGVKASSEVRGAKAASRANDLLPVIQAAQASGATSLRQIAALLNERDTPTLRGEGIWSAVQVQRILSRGAASASNNE